MPLINNAFNGKLNTDVADYRISNGDYLDALNITRDSETEGKDRVVSNILGNTQIPLALPSTGVNKVIGQYADKVRDRLYYFVWNSLGYNRICFYDAKTNSNNIVLESKTQSSGVDILKFNPSNKILSVNVIHRDEGDLLCFLDTNLNEPRVINILDNFGVNWKEEYLSVAKAPPIMPIKCVYENDNEASSITTDLLNAPINAFDNNDVSGEYSIKFDFSSNSYFSLSYDKQTITYTATPNTVKLKLNLNLYADVNNYNIKIVVNGLDVSTESLSGNVYYKELTLPALSTGSYISVKVSNYLGGVFTVQGNLNASSSFASTTAKVTINNLRNSLFQFRYRYVYDNFEKSVWSTDSIVPLPYQLSESLTSQQSNKYTDNARISLSFSSGNEQVSKIEIAFRRFSNNFTSDWQLIDQLNKSEQSIPDNDIVTYKFYNDGIYNPIDILDTEKLQDYVPQKANAGELINGNTLVYSGITEGYDSIKPSISVETSISNTIPSPNTFYYDYNGVLFFASINGNDSGSKGTTMKVYIYGVGTNTGNEVSTLSNAKAEFVIKAIDGSGVDKGGSYVSTNDSVTVSSILGGISSSLVAKGWTQVSIVKNVLTLSYPTNITLLSSGTLLQTDTLNNTTTSFANVFEGSYQVGLMYFDSKGRTNGVITSANGSYNTPANGTGVLSSPTPTNYCKPIVSIASRPPKWASYYQVVRSNNTTYNKRLFWISNSAYSDTSATVTSNKFAYIGIENLEYYNEQIKATEGIVFYNFTQGDRIRFIKRYKVSDNTVQYINYDYEVLGVEVNPNIDGTVKTGRFVKINYPPADDISGSFNFSGGIDFQNYEILLYNYTQKTTSKNKLFFEFGRCFGIGNAGTDNSYHIGDVATQSSTNFATVPAKVSIINGDLFYRKRIVPVSDFYPFQGIAQRQDSPTSLNIIVPTTVENDIYKVQTQGPFGVSETYGAYPTYSDTTQFIFNKSSTNSIEVSLKSLMQFFNVDIDNTVYFKYMVVTSAAKTLGFLTNPVNIIQGQAIRGIISEAKIDTKITLPPNSKLYLYISPLYAGSTNSTQLMGFEMETRIFKSNTTIDIIETSFSDVYNIVTNSNGRETIVDENAKQTYFPTLIRFSQSYQADTNINGTNRFYPDNFDTYDRGFGDVIRLHVRDRYMKVYQQLKVGNVPILTQIVKDVTGNPLQANSDQLINKIQYYSGDYGIGDAGESLAWNNFADYFVDNYRGVVCRLSQDGITPISIVNSMNAFFASKLPAYRKELNSSEVVPDGQIYKGKPCIYGAFDAFTNKYIIVMEEINRYEDDSPL
jgi:hypothetical protein